MAIIVEKKQEGKSDFTKDFFEQAIQHKQYLYQYTDPNQDGFSRSFARANKHDAPVVYLGEQYDYSEPLNDGAVDNLSSVMQYSQIIHGMVSKDYAADKKLTYFIPLIYLMDNFKYRLHVVLLG